MARVPVTQAQGLVPADDMQQMSCADTVGKVKPQGMSRKCCEYVHSMYNDKALSLGPAAPE